MTSTRCCSSSCPPPPPPPPAWAWLRMIRSKMGTLRTMPRLMVVITSSRSHGAMSASTSRSLCRSSLERKEALTFMKYSWIVARSRGGSCRYCAKELTASIRSPIMLLARRMDWFCWLIGCGWWVVVVSVCVCGVGQLAWRTHKIDSMTYQVGHAVVERVCIHARSQQHDHHREGPGGGAACGDVAVPVDVSSVKSNHNIN